MYSNLGFIGYAREMQKQSQDLIEIPLHLQYLYKKQITQEVAIADLKEGQYVGEEESSADVIKSRPLFGKERGYNLRGNGHLIKIDSV